MPKVTLEKLRPISKHWALKGWEEYTIMYDTYSIGTIYLTKASVASMEKILNASLRV